MHIEFQILQLPVHILFTSLLMQPRKGSSEVHLPIFTSEYFEISLQIHYRGPFISFDT